MISKVFATDFKGRSFEQRLGRLTLILGPNGSGKSARTQALQLALMGFIPGGAKTNPEILDAFGSSDRLIVGFAAADAGLSFERGFGRSGSGAVNQAYRINSSRASKEFFNQALGQVGSPKAIDISAFLALSDQKKLDAIFSLFPPEGDPLKVQLEIDKTREQVNGLAAKIKEAEGAIARLAASRAEIQLPPGTLAEMDAEILSHKTGISTLRSQLAAFEAEEIRAKAEADTRAKMAAEAEAAKAPPVIVEAQPALALSPESQALDAKLTKMEQDLQSFKGAATVAPAVEPVVAAAATVPVLFASEVIADLQTVLGSMERSGCQACAARLILKKLIRKYGG